jgi:glucokinase
MSESKENTAVKVGIEICTVGLRAAAIDQAGNLSTTQTVEVVNTDATLERMIAMIADLKRNLGPFDRIGIAVPGLVDPSTGKIAFSTHLPGNVSLDLTDHVQQNAGVRAVVENDANAAAWGEYKIGAGRDCEDMFYATLGEGVGGAFILGGKLWHGASGFAGEFGYVPINSEGMRLEEVASAANIIRRTRGRFHTDSTSSLNKLREESITLEAIISAARADDDFAQMMLGRTGNYVGTAIASVINLVNVGRIVVGGDIMEAKHLVLDAIISRARELAFEPSFNSTRIVHGELGVYAAAAGAALLSADARSKNNSQN